MKLGLYKKSMIIKELYQYYNSDMNEKSRQEFWGLSGLEPLLKGMEISWELIFFAFWYQQCCPKVNHGDIKYFVIVVTILYLYICTHL